MKRKKQSLNMFIVRFARKIASIYPNNCADEEDYIQAGHLKLAEINRDKYHKRDFRAYAVIAIARAMRKTALGAIGAASAPERIKKQVHVVEILLTNGKTEQEICHELKIDTQTLANLKSLITTEPWHLLFNEPTYDSEPFSIIDDLLSSCYLTDEDRQFLRAQFDGNVDSLELTRKQRWLRTKNIRPKLTRSGYGI